MVTLSLIVAAGALGLQTPTEHGVIVECGSAKVELAVASASAFRVSVSFDGAPAQLPTTMVARQTSFADFAPASDGAFAGIKTAFGSVLASASGGFKLLDAAGAVLASSAAFVLTDGGKLPPAPAPATSTATLSSSPNATLFGAGGGGDAVRTLGFESSAPYVANKEFYVPHYHSSDGYSALAVSSICDDQTGHAVSSRAAARRRPLPHTHALSSPVRSFAAAAAATRSGPLPRRVGAERRPADGGLEHRLRALRSVPAARRLAQGGHVRVLQPDRRAQGAAALRVRLHGVPLGLGPLRPAGRVGAGLHRAHAHGLPHRRFPHRRLDLGLRVVRPLASLLTSAVLLSYLLTTTPLRVSLSLLYLFVKGTRTSPTTTCRRRARRRSPTSGSTTSPSPSPSLSSRSTAPRRSTCASAASASRAWATRTA